MKALAAIFGWAPEQIKPHYAEAKKFFRFNKKQVNVAVCGAARSGKTRLIKSLGGVDEHVITWSSGRSNSTLTVTRYFAIDFDCILWEIPGFGQSHVSFQNYCNDYHLVVFDCVLLVTGETLRIEEIQIGVGLSQESSNTSVAFVRSRCDRDLLQNYEDNDDAMTHEMVRKEFLEDGRRRYTNELKKEGYSGSPNIFFISSTYLTKREERLHLNEDEFTTFLNKSTIDAAQKRRDEFRRELRIEETTSIAFCGRLGTGKTTLLKALRRYLTERHFHDILLPIKKKSERYQFKIDSYNVNFFDITGNNYDSEYFWDRKLIAFDGILIVVGELISEPDISIVRRAQRHGVPLRLVASKCDLILTNTLEKKSSVEGVRKHFHRQLLSFDCSFEPLLVSEAALMHPDKKELEIDEQKLCEFVVSKFHGETMRFLSDLRQRKDTADEFVIIHSVRDEVGEEIQKPDS